MADQPQRDFFISRRGCDAPWAEWIASILEQAGFTTYLQDWDFVAGSDFIERMQTGSTYATRTIAVVTEDYLASGYCKAEWNARLAEDPEGKQQKLIPIRVRECKPTGLYGKTSFIDVVGKSEQATRDEILRHIASITGDQRMTPDGKPAFPGDTPPDLNDAPSFPGGLPAIWHVPHRRNRNFTGREQLLADLAQSLASGQPAALTQAIHGLGGVGKTQLATEYAYAHASRYKLVWWIDAETSTGLTQGLVDLARRIELPGSADAAAPDVAAAAIAWLNGQRDWLLIFDNVPTPEDIRGHLPDTPDGHVLITSRHPDWAGLARPLPVTKWSREESIQFLTQRTGKSESQAADQLAFELGDLPLALAQAAGYIESTQTSVADYLKTFRTHRKSLWNTEPPPDDYEKTVATTWEVALQQLSGPAVNLLRLVSFLAPDEIPRSLPADQAESLPPRLAKAAANPVKFGDCVRELRGFGLIEASSEVLSVHRLVQAVVRERLSKEQRKRWAMAVVSVLNAACTYEQNDPVTWQATSRLVVHARAAVQLASTLDVGAEQCGHLLNDCGLALLMEGQFGEARKLLQRALTMNELVYAHDHPMLASSCSNLATVEKDLGNLNEARDLLQRAITIDEQAYADDHPTLAIRYSNLATVERNLGNLDEARELLQRAITIEERAYADDHPTLAISYWNLAWVEKDLGNLNEAIGLARRAYQICRDRLGLEHPSTKGTAGWLAKNDPEFNAAD